MSAILMLYGSLVLTVLAFILPILTITLSLFPDGTKSLAKKYENEKKQAENNIKEQIKKGKDEEIKDLDCDRLSETIKALKAKMKEAEIKISYLSPTKLFVKLSTPFAVALLGVFAALSVNDSISRLFDLFFSIGAFLCGGYILWESLSIVTEVSQIVQAERGDTNEKIIELLSSLVETSSEKALFIKEGEMKLIFNKEKVTKSKTFDFSVNKKHEIPISISNSSTLMAKNVEVGLIFPDNFLIEKTSNISLNTGENKQIVRFNADYIQAHENLLQGKLKISFLSTGEYKIEIFIKGENVTYNKFEFNLNIVN